MHILVVNDDGPPSSQSSPYVHTLVRALQGAGHTVSVCLPHTQRSWIGKAHLIGQTVRPTYYRPPAPPANPAGLIFDKDVPESEGSTHKRPTTTGHEEWVLVDGTPASCVQIGLHHMFADRGKVDLVLSGPNYGRNTTALFALSSGTLGGALEGAACRVPSIALSYAFFTRNHDPEIVAGASRHAVRVVEALVKQWPQDGSVDLYSVNIPLVEGVEKARTLWTPMLQNYWADGGCFTAVEGAGDEDEDDTEERIREGAGGEAAVSSGKADDGGGEGTALGRTHKHFKWQPRFTDVYKSVEDAPPGNDGWAVKEGHTSVTPLKANFWQAATHLHGQDLKLPVLESREVTETIPIRSGTESAVATTQQSVNETSPVGDKGTQDSKNTDKLHALVAYDDPYVQPLIVDALKSLLPSDRYCLVDAPEQQPEDKDNPVSVASLIPGDGSKALQITSYEAIDFDYASEHPNSVVINSYKFRKALIRKHFLATTVENWVIKYPDSVLARHVKPSSSFEVDYAEFLDDALVEAWDLRASLENEEKREWWILKPSMSDRGQGIRLFSTMKELQAIFDEWDVDTDDEDEEADGIMAAHLRHFVAQPYIDPPLLLPGDRRKFHIRTYVLCVGAMKVYVYHEMLALFAGREYRAPSSDEGELDAHLTNTCLQNETTAASATSGAKDGEAPAPPLVLKFWDLPEVLVEGRTDVSKGSIFSQICEVTGAVFEAAARGMPMHFSPLTNAFEVFGVDFLVDAQGVAWLLEVNSFPDFKQTGDELRDDVVAELWRQVLRLAVVEGGPLRLGGKGVRDDDDDAATETRSAATGDGKMVLVKDVDLGKEGLLGFLG
ncbi:hypothetical protein PspLS_06131 [Pyricularia sp. CBS 133598]|nr:hypothetical protein PspLS_06131 [Pyricularia sp. CBS 133598]